MTLRGPITVGYDGSLDAGRAASWAGGVAAALAGTPVHLVHAISLPAIPPHHWQLSVEALLEQQETEIREQLAAERRALVERGVAGELFVRRWLPVETVLEHAREHASGLVVVGQHGHRRTRRLLGTVSDAVARQAEMPVVVVRGRETPSPPRTVLLAFDGSQPARRAAEAVARWFPEAAVRAVRVENGAGKAEPAETLRLLAEAGIAAGRIELRTASGNAAAALLELAGDPAVDLVAAGRRGRSAWAELLIGGVTEKLLQLAPCPVLVAH